MSSLSVELFEGSFCFADELVVAPQPKVRIDPACPLQSSWVWWEVSTYQPVLVRESAKSKRGREQVQRRYFSTHFHFPQSSSSDCFTLIVRKATVIWMSQQNLERKRSWAVVWWNAQARFSGRNRVSMSMGGRIRKRWSATGEDNIPIIFSENAASILSM